MATGFTGIVLEGIRHFNVTLRVFGAIIFSIVCVNANAVNVTVVGLFPGKAVVVIGNGSPRTISVGQRQAENVTLISTATNSAVLDIDGKRHTLELGEHFSAPGNGANSGNTLTLSAESGGQFWAMGQINGKSVRFLVDTGASSVALPASTARAMGIDFTKGQRGLSATAGGVMPIWRVTLDAVSIGEITLYRIEATVFESGLDVALLGMSFLNRLEMKREGTQMTLNKRF